MQDHYQAEISAKENLGRSLNKALGEADMLRVRYEKEGVAKAEELEMAKLKMQVGSGCHFIWIPICNFFLGTSVRG